MISSTPSSFGMALLTEPSAPAVEPVEVEGEKEEDPSKCRMSHGCPGRVALSAENSDST